MSNYESFSVQCLSVRSQECIHLKQIGIFLLLLLLLCFVLHTYNLEAVVFREIICVYYSVTVVSAR